MGLDISHDAFSASYTAFNRFRKAVAEAIGGSYPPHDEADLDSTRWYWGHAANADLYPGLEVFFNHDDCQGEIDPDTCGKIADEMEPLLPALDQAGGGEGHILRDGGYGAVMRRFIAGCRAAQAANEQLEFS